MEENIYDFLGLTPKDGEAKVKEELEAQIKKWTIQLIRQGARAEAKLEVLKRFKAELDSNPNMLKEHADKYKTLVEQKKKQLEKSIREDASIYVVNGQIEEVILNELISDYSVFSKEEILSIIGATIKKKKEFKYKETGSGRELAPILFKRILEDLAKVKKRDLYDFLSVPANAPASLINQIADGIYAENQKRPANDEKTTVNNLVGHSKNILLDASKRADYDYTCGNQVFSSVRSKIERIASGTDRIIRPEQYKALLEECTKKGMHYDKAEYMIYKTAEQYKVTIIEPIHSIDFTTVLGSGIALSLLHDNNNFILHNVFVKNTPLPCAKMIHARTCCENQKTICLGIYVHNHAHTSTDMLSDLKLVISKNVQLPKPLPINSPIDIMVGINDDGMLTNIHVIDVLNDDVIIVQPELNSIN